MITLTTILCLFTIFGWIKHYYDYKKVGYIDSDIEKYYWKEFCDVWVERNGKYPQKHL